MTKTKKFQDSAKKWDAIETNYMAFYKAAHGDDFMDADALKCRYNSFLINVMNESPLFFVKGKECVGVPLDKLLGAALKQAFLAVGRGMDCSYADYISKFGFDASLLIERYVTVLTRHRDIKGMSALAVMGSISDNGHIAEKFKKEFDFLTAGGLDDNGHDEVDEKVGKFAKGMTAAASIHLENAFRRAINCAKDSSIKVSVIFGDRFKGFIRLSIKTAQGVKASNASTYIQSQVQSKMALSDAGYAHIVIAPSDLISYASDSTKMAFDRCDLVNITPVLNDFCEAVYPLIAMSVCHCIETVGLLRSAKDADAMLDKRLSEFSRTLNNFKDETCFSTPDYSGERIYATGHILRQSMMLCVGGQREDEGSKATVSGYTVSANMNFNDFSMTPTLTFAARLCPDDISPWVNESTGLLGRLPISPKKVDARKLERGFKSNGVYAGCDRSSADGHLRLAAYGLIAFLNEVLFPRTRLFSLTTPTLDVCRDSKIDYDRAFTCPNIKGAATDAVEHFILSTALSPIPVFMRKSVCGIEEMIAATRKKFGRNVNVAPHLEPVSITGDIDCVWSYPVPEDTLSEGAQVEMGDGRSSQKRSSQNITSTDIASAVRLTSWIVTGDRSKRTYTKDWKDSELLAGAVIDVLRGRGKPMLFVTRISDCEAVSSGKETSSRCEAVFEDATTKVKTYRNVSESAVDKELRPHLDEIIKTLCLLHSQPSSSPSEYTKSSEMDALKRQIKERIMTQDHAQSGSRDNASKQKDQSGDKQNASTSLNMIATDTYSLLKAIHRRLKRHASSRSQQTCVKGIDRNVVASILNTMTVFKGGSVDKGEKQTRLMQSIRSLRYRAYLKRSMTLRPPGANLAENIDIHNVNVLSLDYVYRSDNGESIRLVRASNFETEAMDRDYMRLKAVSPDAYLITGDGSAVTVGSRSLFAVNPESPLDMEVDLLGTKGSSLSGSAVGYLNLMAKQIGRPICTVDVRVEDCSKKYAVFVLPSAINTCPESRKIYPVYPAHDAIKDVIIRTAFKGIYDQSEGLRKIMRSMTGEDEADLINAVRALDLDEGEAELDMLSGVDGPVRRLVTELLEAMPTQRAGSPVGCGHGLKINVDKKDVSTLTLTLVLSFLESSGLTNYGKICITRKREDFYISTSKGISKTRVIKPADALTKRVIREAESVASNLDIPPYTSSFILSEAMKNAGILLSDPEVKGDDCTTQTSLAVRKDDITTSNGIEKNTLMKKACCIRLSGEDTGNDANIREAILHWLWCQLTYNITTVNVGTNQTTIFSTLNA